MLGSEAQTQPTMTPTTNHPPPGHAPGFLLPAFRINPTVVSGITVSIPVIPLIPTPRGADTTLIPLDTKPRKPAWLLGFLVSRWYQSASLQGFTLVSDPRTRCTPLPPPVDTNSQRTFCLKLVAPRWLRLSAADAQLPRLVVNQAALFEPVDIALGGGRRH